MSRPAVVFDGVWKKFRKGERHDSLRDLIPATIARLVRPRPAGELQDQEFWAVKDVSFEVKPGEALGIIGPNGAGKSTTLKLLTKILKPTLGRCEVRGRVGALIEIAAGFHPDLTGRENVYLQGAILGMSRADVAASFDDIVDFAGVASFVDTPVKRFSSGMQARLGFSIAVHLRPDVLLVDEVLSVGDVSFQMRCIERMHEQLRNGVALVFVSHNLQAISSICDRCLVFGGGAKLFDGAPREATHVYMTAGRTSSARHGATDPTFSVLTSDFLTADGVPRVVQPHEPCFVRVAVRCDRDSPPVSFGLEVERTRDMLYVYGTTSEELGHPLASYRQGDMIEVTFSMRAHFCRGHYRLNFHVRDPRAARFLGMAENVASFTVDEPVSFDGVVDPELEVRVEKTGAGR
jgi:lipopolysaccharide transport system ATP-binding protein